MPALTKIDIRLAELRFSTQAYINDQPSLIVLMPSRGTKVQAPSGGHNYGTPVARPLQYFRLARNPRPDGIQYSPTDGGESRKVSYTLVGAWDSIMAYGDTWDETMPDNTINHYHIDYVDASNSWERTAHVTAFSQEPTHG